MDEHTYEVDTEATIRVTAHKDLTLQGDAVSHVHLSGAGATQASWTATDTQYILEVTHNIVLTVPQNARIYLTHVGGQCQARDLSHGLTGDAIGGHVRFERMGDIAIHHIGGHLHVNGCRGHVQGHQVGGHVHLEQCHGDVRIDHIGGHVKGFHIDGQCHLPTINGHAHLEHIGKELQLDAGGHVRVSINPQGEQTYDIRSGGRLACYIPHNAHATIAMDSPTLPSHEERIVGDGTAQVHLSAGAHIALVEVDPAQPSPDPVRKAAEDVKEAQWTVDGIAQQIRTSVHQVMGQVSEKVNQALKEHGLDTQQREDLQAQFQDIRRDALESAREAAETVQTQTRHIWEQEVKPHLFTSSDPDASATPTAHALAEERKMILRMLSEGKITVDEANELLKTLSQ